MNTMLSVNKFTAAAADTESIPTGIYPYPKGYDILYEHVWTRFNIAHCMGAHAGISETQAMHGQIG